MKEKKIIISGIVQGVGFRPFLFNLLNTKKLTGTIKNTGNLGVTLHLQSEDANFSFENLMEEISQNIPDIALIEDIKLEDIDIKQKTPFTKLTIIPSNQGTGKGLTLPPDIAMCDKCLAEFQDPQNDRFGGYDFIACAQCGPRFTIMRQLPYDRPLSTMVDFGFCDKCEENYHDFNDRRFHAQTFSCKICGPKYRIFTPNEDYDSNQFQLPKESIDAVVNAILDGKIVALKGIGGANLICRADKFEVIEKLRNRKKERKLKPFAVMFPSLSEAKKYCEIPPIIEPILSSYRRPITLVTRNKSSLPNNLAPGLSNLGIILPYMGIHYLLFEKLGPIPLVFTSGNYSSLPIGIDNETILNDLSNLADIFYLHNRTIFQRCDDSLIRLVNNCPTLIRRSRGYVPEYLKLPFNPNVGAIIAVGAELNSTGAVARGPRIFPTQHIGNVRNLETFTFLQDSIAHLQQLLRISDSEIKLIIRDLHPAFQSTRLSGLIYEKLELDSEAIQVIPVQHHHAHMASLMVDHQLGLNENIVCITVDGVGYGQDKQPWGGEILVGGYKEYKRAGHLESIPMIGGDLCAKFPPRMLLCALLTSKRASQDPSLIAQINELLQLQQYFPQGKIELDYIKGQFDNDLALLFKKYPLTSSFGRVLDAISSLFNVCQDRSYRGEPAIRLETYVEGGQYTSHFDLEGYLRDSIILSSELLWDYTNLLLNSQINSTADDKKNLAYSLLVDLSTLIAKLAVIHAKSKKIRKIGISGGVACNDLIVRTIKTYVLNAGFTFLQHNTVPCGDAGISIGQIAVGAAKHLG
jgi:hydrogenase maturation protein HypF